MTFLWWSLIFILFVLSFIGIVMPILPGIPFIWAGFLIYHFAIDSISSWNFWMSMILISVFILVADYLVSGHWVRRWGGSKVGSYGAVLGVLIGPFIFGPIGMVVLPFLLVILIEVLRGVHFEKAIKMGLASLIGLIGSSIAKGILQLIMLIIFFLYI